jgi:hypothetical protein
MTREIQSQLLGEFYAEKKNVMKLKGEDYANEDVLSNFKTAGANIGISAEQQCLSLIATKVARLGNLLSGKTPNNESVSDSILDLSNYTDLLYCLVNEEEENLITKDDLGKIKSAFNKNKADFLKRKHAKSQPLTIGECIEPEPQTKRWENVKPKGIIQAMKDNQKSLLKEIMKQDEKDGLYEPTKEPYEPKVGDRFTNKIGIIWEITNIEKLYFTLINDIKGDVSKDDIDRDEMMLWISNGTLKKIN